MSYYVDTSSRPARYYAAFLVAGGHVYLANVERPEAPAYVLPLAVLFTEGRFKEVEATLDMEYNPVRFRLRRDPLNT